MPKEYIVLFHRHLQLSNTGIERMTQEKRSYLESACGIVLRIGRRLSEQSQHNIANDNSNRLDNLWYAIEFMRWILLRSENRPSLASQHYPIPSYCFMRAYSILHEGAAGRYTPILTEIDGECNILGTGSYLPLGLENEREKSRFGTIASSPAPSLKISASHSISQHK